MKKIGFLFISLIATFITQAAVADDSRWWLNAGVGVGSFVFHNKDYYKNMHESGPAAEFSFNYMVKNNQLFTVRGTGVVGTSSAFGTALGCAFMSPLTSTCDSAGATVADVGFLYGYIYKRPRGYLSASAGLALVAAIPPTITVVGVGENTDRSTRYRVGLPVDIQAFWTPSRYFGLGLIGFADVNARYSNVGALVAIQLGRLTL